MDFLLAVVAIGSIFAAGTFGILWQNAKRNFRLWSDPVRPDGSQLSAALADAGTRPYAILPRPLIFAKDVANTARVLAIRGMAVLITLLNADSEEVVLAVLRSTSDAILDDAFRCLAVLAHLADVTMIQIITFALQHRPDLAARFKADPDTASLVRMVELSTKLQKPPTKAEETAPQSRPADTVVLPSGTDLVS